MAENNNNNDAKEWFAKGLTYFEANKFEEALNAYEKAIEIFPAIPEAWTNKGNTLTALGRNDEALKAYDEALRLNPNLVEARMNKRDRIERTRTWVVTQFPDKGNDALTISFRANGLNILTADGLMRMLYFGTLLKIFQNVFEVQVRFTCVVVKRRQVFGIFSKSQPHGLIHKIGDGPICLHSFHSQGTMKVRIEINGGSFV